MYANISRYVVEINATGDNYSRDIHISVIETVYPTNSRRIMKYYKRAYREIKKNKRWVF